MSDWIDSFGGWACETGLIFPNRGAKGTNVYTPSGTTILQAFESLVTETFSSQGFERVSTPFVVNRESIERLFGSRFQQDTIGTEGSNEALKTSDEPLLHPILKRIQSPKQLPVEYFSQTRIFRDVSDPSPLWRDREILWYESQALYDSRDGALEGVLKGIDYFEKLYEALGISPLILRRGSENKAHPYGEALFSVFTPTPGGLIENGTIVLYDPDALDYRYQVTSGTGDYEIRPWQVSIGHSLRSLSAALLPAASGDCLPSVLAPPTPLVVMAGEEEVIAAARDIQTRIDKQTELVVPDDLGEQLHTFESRGVPLRLEIGPKEAKAGDVTLYNELDETRRTMNVKNLDLSEHFEQIDKRLAENTRKLRSQYVGPQKSTMGYQVANSGTIEERLFDEEPIHFDELLI